jgi:protein-S-isoprenylcysteine O-methyltransferase Ste14
VGLGLIASAMVNFTRSGTTIRPDRASTSLVIAGPYKFTRNPMYVGMAIAYLGRAIADGRWQA